MISVAAALGIRAEFQMPQCAPTSPSPEVAFHCSSMDENIHMGRLRAQVDAELVTRPPATLMLPPVPAAGPTPPCAARPPCQLPASLPEVVAALPAEAPPAPLPADGPLPAVVLGPVPALVRTRKEMSPLQARR